MEADLPRTAGDIRVRAAGPVEILCPGPGCGIEVALENALVLGRVSLNRSMLFLTYF